MMSSACFMISRVFETLAARYLDGEGGRLTLLSQDFEREIDRDALCRRR